MVFVRQSMSNIPYYLPGARTGFRLGHKQVVDGLIHDGLWDPYDNQHMGMCGEDCATKLNLTRADQDNYAIESYKRSANAWAAGKFNDEVAPITIAKRGGDPIVVSKDEEYTNIKMDKVSTLKPAFKKDGTVTAVNSSTLNDGAAAMVLTSGKLARELGLTPLFKVREINTFEIVLMTSLDHRNAL